MSKRVCIKQFLVGLPKHQRSTREMLWKECYNDHCAAITSSKSSSGLMFATEDTISRAELKRLRGYGIVSVSERFVKAYFFNIKLKPNRKWYMLTTIEAL